MVTVVSPQKEIVSGAADSPLVLFICRNNSAASILAEAILRHLSQGRVRAASAGDTANIRVDPYALECLVAHDIATTGLHSKPWGRFFGLGCPPVHILITLCDAYATRVQWDRDAVHTIKVHWPTPEPELILGSPTDKRLAFEEVFVLLVARIRKLLSLRLNRLSDPALPRLLAGIGEGS